MKLITPSSDNQIAPLRQIRVFLAGSIEMGLARNWQADAIAALSHLPITIYNPRHDAYDPSLPQTLDNDKFTKQVNWELDAIEKSDIVFFNFEANTKSPISLLELGILYGTRRYSSGQIVIVTCPAEYWRSGNVNIVSNRANFPVIENFDNGLKLLVDTATEEALIYTETISSLTRYG